MRKYKEVANRILALILMICMVTTLMPAMPVLADSSIQNTNITLYKDAAFTTPVTSTTYTYTGTAITPYVKVMDGATVLTQGTDYQVTYQNNINSGTASVVISGRGAYSGSTSVAFDIQKVNISYLDVTCGLIDNGVAYCFYDGTTSIKPEIKAVKGLVAGSSTYVTFSASDYTVDYTNNNKVYVGPTGAAGPSMTVKLNADSNYTFINGVGQTVYYRIYYNMESSTVSIGGIGTMTFNGLAQTPVPTVSDTYNPDVQMDNTDYVYAWTNNTNAGQATLTLTGTGEYKGTKSVNFPIAPANISNNAVSVDLNPAIYSYTGSKIALDDYVTVKIGSYVVPNTSYSLIYDANYSGALGTNAVTVTGKNNLTGSIEKQFKIVNAVTNYSLNATTFTYTGSVVKPTITVMDRVGTIVPSSNYTVTYYSTADYDSGHIITNPTAVGTYYIMITGNPVNNFSGTLGSVSSPISYTITPKAIGDCSFTIGSQAATGSSDIKYSYNGSEQKKVISITDNTTPLIESQDYQVEYLQQDKSTPATSFVNAGLYYIRITGLGAYSGSTYILHYTITPKIVVPTLTITDQTFTGNPIVPAASDITLADTDSDPLVYKVISCTNNTAIGTNSATLIVQLTGNYTTSSSSTVGGTTYAGTVTGKFTIAPKKISQCTCNLVSSSSNYDSSQLSFVYNGQVQTPKVVIKDGSKALVEGTDYSVGYYTSSACLANQSTTGQKNVGTCYVKIEGLNAYSSPATDASIVVPYQVTQKSLTTTGVTANATNQAYTGTAVPAALTVMDGENALTVNTDYSIAGYYSDATCLTTSAHSDAGLVYVKLNGQGNYSGSVVTSFYIGSDINKLAGSVTVTGAPFTYNTKSHHDEITAGIQVFDTAGEIIDPNNYSIKFYADAAHATEITADTNELFKNAGTVYIGIVGKNGYYGTFYSSCTINKMDISGMDAQVNGTNVYTGKAIALAIYNGIDTSHSDGVQLTFPAISVVAGTFLSATDFSIQKYANNINAGTATVTLAGTGNYTGTKNVNFTIDQKSLTALGTESTVTVNIPKTTFTSRKQYPTVNVTYGSSNTPMIANTDYSVDYFLDPSFSTPATDANLINAGSVYVKITGKGNYKDLLTTYAGTNVYTIDPLDINDAKVTVDITGKTYVYSAIGNASKIPTLTVRYEYTTSNFYQLTAGTEYTFTPTTVTYHIGSQDLIFTGKGNFTGTKTIRYYYQGNMSNSANEVTVAGINPTYPYTPTTATDGITCSNITVRDNNGQVITDDCYTVTYMNNKAAGTGTVMISGNNAKYWTGTYSQDFKIIGSISDAVITIPDQAYIGTAYTADTLKDIKVVADGYELKKNIDYKIVDVKNATDAALSTSSNPPSISIQGIGDYFAGVATTSANFSIKYAIDGAGLTVASIPTQTYTGSAVEPPLIVKYHKADDSYVDLTKDTDYTVKYYNNKEVAAANGTSGPYAVITTTANGLLSGSSKTIPFSIGKVDLTSGYTINGISEGQDFSYTGAIIKPTFTVEKGGVVVDPSNYTISYSWLPSTSYPVAGSVETMKVVGTGNYVGTITVNFNVIPRDISTGSAFASATIANQTYTGSPIEPVFDLTFTDYAGKPQKLKLGTDYRIVGYFANTGALAGDTNAPYTDGPYVQIASISGSNCTGVRNIPFTILPKSMDKLTYSAVSDMTYAAGVDKFDPALTVNMSATSVAPLVKNTDYYVEYVNDTGVGKSNLTNGPYIHIIPASGNFIGEKIIPYNILPKSIKSTDVAITLQDPADSTFDANTWNYPYKPGKTYLPTVVVTDNTSSTNPITLTKGTDYSVSYADNAFTGTATVTVTGTGNYAESKPIKFTIGILFNSSKIAVYKDNVQVTSIPSVTYDGTDKTPTGISVKLLSNASLLNQDAAHPDYKIQYYTDSACTTEIAQGSLINAGTYYVAITGIADAGYVGSLVLPYTIKQKPINSSDIVATAIPDQLYTASGPRPTFELKDTSVNQVIPESAYDVQYEYTKDGSNIKIGPAKVIIKANANGNYTGPDPKTIYFNVVEQDLATAMVNTIPDYDYTGSEITPDPEVYVNGNRLVKDRDYTLSYGNNSLKAGLAWVSILGKGNYKGKYDASFKIKADLRTATVSTITSAVYTGQAIKPTVKVVCGGNLLTAGVDYNVSYGFNTNIGDAYIYISPASNPCYIGSTQIKFTICNDINAATVVGIPDSQAYTKEAITPEPVVVVGGKTLTKGTDYVVKWTNDVNVGTASVVITGAGKYAGTKTVNYNIIAKGIARCTVDAIADLNYTGRYQEPTVVVRDGNKILAEGTDYTVLYSNNQTIGTATATVIGRGNYSGSSMEKFDIISPTITGLMASSWTNNSAKISWAKADNITGYQIYTSDSRTLVNQTIDTSTIINNLEAGLSYKYKVRTYTKIGENTYYGAFSPVAFISSKNGIIPWDSSVSGVYIPEDDGRSIRAGAIIDTTSNEMTYECTVIDYGYATYGTSMYPAVKKTKDKSDNWMTYTPTHAGMYGFCWRAYKDGKIVSEAGATHYFKGNSVSNVGIWVPDRNASKLKFGMVFDSPDKDNVRIQWFVYRPDDNTYEAVLNDGLVKDNGVWQQWTKKPGRYWIMCRVTATNNLSSSVCWGVEVRNGVVIDPK